MLRESQIKYHENMLEEAFKVARRNPMNERIWMTGLLKSHEKQRIDDILRELPTEDVLTVIGVHCHSVEERELAMQRIGLKELTTPIIGSKIFVYGKLMASLDIIFAPEERKTKKTTSTVVVFLESVEEDTKAVATNPELNKAMPLRVIGGVSKKLGLLEAAGIVTIQDLEDASFEKLVSITGVNNRTYNVLLYNGASILSDACKEKIERVKEINKFQH